MQQLAILWIMNSRSLFPAFLPHKRRALAQDSNIGGPQMCDSLKILMFAIVSMPTLAIANNPTTKESTEHAATEPDELVEHLSQARIAINATGLSASDLKAAKHSYEWAWRRAIKSTESASAVQKKQIIDLWNAEWKNGRWQSVLAASLAYSANRDFLTKDVIHTFVDSEDPEVLRGVCYIVLNNGTSDDLNILKDKVAAEKDQAKRDIIALTISWFNYRLKHDENDPGPPQFPPAPESN